VEAAGVCAGVGGVPIDRVEVGRARNVGVAGGNVAGEAQPDNKVKPIRKAASRLVFIFISSSRIISPAKRKKPGEASLAFRY
jgi:hypothetical protein